VRDPWLYAALLLALVLRLVGLGHGLPFVYNPDEVNIMARALSVARDLNPHYFLYPSFFFYFIFGVMGGLFVLGRLVGWYENLGDFESQFFEDPTRFYIAGRLVGVAAALGTIVLTYHLAQRHFGRVAARAAAFFLAVTYFHVRDAHYLKHDVPVGFLVVLALVVFDRAMDRRTRGTYVASGVAMGLAFATHYYTIFLAPTFALCHWISSRFRKLRNLVVAALASAVTFFLLSPFVVLSLGEALEHMKANRQVVMDRSLDTGAFFLPSFPAYMKFLAEQGLGYLLLLLVIAGWILMAKRGMRYVVLWGTFPLLFFGLLSYTFFAGRYLNVIAPSLVVAGGVAIGAIYDRRGKAAAIVLTALACAQPFYNALQVDRLFRGEDTRTLARRWIVENVSDQSAIALQSYSVPLPQTAASIRSALDENGALDELDRKGKYAHMVEVAETMRPAFALYFLGRGDERNRLYFDYRTVIDEELAPLTRSGVSTIVLRQPPDKPPPEVAAFFGMVREKGHLLQQFSPFPDDGAEYHPYMDNEDWAPHRALSHKGPLVEVWSLEE
jgi:MFS family permease